MCWLWRRAESVCDDPDSLSFHEECFKRRDYPPRHFGGREKDEKHAFLSCTPTSQFKWIPSAHSHSLLLRFFSFFLRHELLYPNWKHRRSSAGYKLFFLDLALFKVVRKTRLFLMIRVMQPSSEIYLEFANFFYVELRQDLRRRKKFTFAACDPN